MTGAFSYTGRHITQKLLAMGSRVRTLTRNPNQPHSFSSQVSTAPFHFENPAALVETLRGATTLFNTYWVRFVHGQTTFDQAVENTKTLFSAAKAAGVNRIVHISVTNASEQSPLPYFKGKGRLERLLHESVPSYAIIRPTLVFGIDDILLNNIVWLLKHFPLFVIPGSGEYRLQPVFVGDLADIAIREAQSAGNPTIDAAGPELYTFNELIALLADESKSRSKVVRANPVLVMWLLKSIGYLVHDVVLTHDELTGLMSNLLVSAVPPTGSTRLSTWLDEHQGLIGRSYTSELGRNWR